MYILGISAFYHDSAAAILKDGRVIAAAQEERFTRVKHDSGFPVNAIEYCLQTAGIKKDRLDYVAYYESYQNKLERVLETITAFVPRGFATFLKSLPGWFNQKSRVDRILKSYLGSQFKGKIIYSTHHRSHAASAFFMSGFSEAAVLTIDGVGEWSTTTISAAEGNKIKILKEMRFPHSLGLLYSAFTSYLGFRVNSGEYKVMGLAPYGEPKYADLILDKMIDLKEDGSFWTDMSYFDYCYKMSMTSRKFHSLMGDSPREPESELTQRHMDIAASIQAVTEIVMLRMARHARKITNKSSLCLAGGCALNCVANGIIQKEKIFDRIFVQPAAGDAGCALGAALHVWHECLGNENSVQDTDKQHGSYLGPEYSDDEIRGCLEQYGMNYQCLEEDMLIEEIAKQIDGERVIGWFDGRMEFGPRALGSRSIIGDARSEKMQSQMNLKIKFRESFRPFAPSVLAEQAGRYFDFDGSSPYMLMVAPVKKELRIDTDTGSLFGIEKLKVKRSVMPAITHVDYSARIQTVHRETNPRYYRLIEQFGRLTDCSVIVNTSFNIRGEPIVCTPEDALRCFMYTHIDTLVLGNFVLLKEDQKTWPGAEQYKNNFSLD